MIRSAAYPAVKLSRIALQILICGFFLLPWLFPADRSAALNGYQESYRILDRDGQLLREAVNPAGMRAVWTPLEDFDPFVLQAVTAAEDSSFYKHRGVDFRAVVRAVKQNLLAGEIQSGASTITMQLARIVTGSSGGWRGKITQIYTARRLEAGLSKDEIMELYLNRVPLGRGNLGIAAASYEYFGLSHQLMSRSQICLLAGIIQGPGVLNPAENPQRARFRRQYVLTRLTEEGTISAEEADALSAEPVLVWDGPAPPQAMHFTDFVMSQNPDPGDVRTALDNGLNKSIESLVRSHSARYAKNGLPHAAVVVLDNETLEIRAMVGSPDYWDQNMGANNGVTMLRQPGSTLKPFVYALAFEHGWQPGDVLPDVAYNYLGSDDRLYQPSNFSGRFSGPVQLQDALTRSLNIPAIRLTENLGLDPVLDRLRLAGFESLDQDAGFYGLGLTLGSGEVTLLELAAGYAVFANRGLYRPPTVFPVSTNETEAGHRVFQERTAFLITEILSNDRLRIRAFGSNNPLLMNFPVSVKTGTSNNWRDNWTVGCTRHFTVAVWAGSFAGQPSNQSSGTIGAGPLFHQAAALVNRHYPDTETRLIWSTPPEGITRQERCIVSGQIPHADCPASVRVYETLTGEEQEECTVHRALTIDSRTGLALRPGDHSDYAVRRVFEYLPSEYAEWEARNGRPAPPDPYRYSAPESISAPVITHPVSGDVYIFEPGYNPSTQSVELKAEVPSGVTRIDWLVNGAVLASRTKPFSASLPSAAGEYVIVARAGQRESDPVFITVR